MKSVTEHLNQDRKADEQYQRCYRSVVDGLVNTKAVRPLLLWGMVAMALGYGLSCRNLVTPPNALTETGLSSWLVAPPFVPPTHPVNLWTMSQRAGSVSYLTFGAGLSLAGYALFIWACDVRRWQIGIWRTLGTYALAGYVIHGVVGWGVRPRPKRPPSCKADES